MPPDDRDRRSTYSRAAGPARIGFLAIAAFVALIAGWGALAPLSNAAIAEGALQVEGRRQSVQHPYGGVVKELFVAEGDRVEKGQVLLTLSDTELRSNLDVLRAERIGLVAARARMIAERDGSTEPAFPDISAAASEAVASERAILSTRNRQHQSSVTVFEKKIQQLRETIVGAEAEAQSLERQAELIDEELQAARKLLEQGYTPRPRVLALEREASQLIAALAAKRSEIAAADQSIAEAEAEIARLDRQRLAGVAEELRETEAKLAAVGPKIEAAEDALTRTEIRAPATGEIVALSVFTEGGVVQQGASLMEIVPSAALLFVDARLKPTDLYGIAPGQAADIQLLSTPRNERPKLSGKVRTVSADRLTDERSGQDYYALQVQLDPDDVAAAAVALQAGMPVQVVMETRARTLIDYLTSPLADEVSGAFRER